MASRIDSVMDRARRAESSADIGLLGSPDALAGVLALPEGPLLVASEPIDSLSTWNPVPDRHLVVARPGHYRVDELTMTGVP